MSLRALLIDDHPLIMDALASALTTSGIFAATVKAGSLRQAVNLLALDADYALVITDLRMEDVDGIEAVANLRESFPDLPLVVYSGDSRKETIVAAFEQGVRGYITKDQPLGMLTDALRQVMAGGCYLPLHAQALPMSAPISNNEAANDEANEAANEKVTQEAPDGSSATLSRLSSRQLEVFKLLLHGIPNKVIAERLELAEGTVKTHLNMIYRVIGVSSRAQAILRAYELGLLA